MVTWKEKLILSDGQELRHTGSSMKGSLQETDVDTYDILDGDGAKVGTVMVEDHTAIRGFRRTISVCQRDLAGKVVVETSWRVQQ